MERPLPYNYDGSSCFMNSLLCALFFPTKLRVIDPYLLQGKRADLQQHSELQDLCYVLRTMAKCIRGSKTGDVDVYIMTRPLIAHYLHHLANVKFDYGQHDPVDLFEALLRVYNVGGVFVTRKTVESEYSNGKKTSAVTMDQMFRYSVMHTLKDNQHKFETLFPSVETLVLGTPHVESKGQETLTKQRTIIEFVGGPVLVLTRETFTKQVDYGRWSRANNSWVLPILNTVERSVNWYELQAVLCWKGQVFETGESGHYVCFVYDDSTKMWYLYNDMDCKARGIAGLDFVSQPEAHPEYAPSRTGTMFIYTKVVAPPNDV